MIRPVLLALLAAACAPDYSTLRQVQCSEIGSLCENQSCCAPALCVVKLEGCKVGVCQLFVDGGAK